MPLLISTLNLLSFLGLTCSVRHLHVLQFPVCVFPPRREECVEDVPAELGGGAEDLRPGRRLCGGLHRTEERL